MEALRDKRRENYNDFKTNIISKRKTNKNKINSISLKRALLLKRYASLFMLISSFLLLLSMVIGYTKMVNINSDIRVKKIENSEIEMTISEIEKELEPYISNKRIERIASSRLGMIYPSEENIVNIKPSQKEVANNDELDTLFSLFE